MSWLFDGIPLHPLFVHAAVVAVPVVALLALAAAWSPRARTRLGIVFPVLASLAAVATLLTSQSGEALAEQVDRTAAVTAHTEIADIALAGAILLLLASWTQWSWDHLAIRARPGRDHARVRSPRVARAGALTISIGQTLVAVFAIVAMVVVGDTGARAVWLA